MPSFSAAGTFALSRKVCSRNLIFIEFQRIGSKSASCVRVRVRVRLGLANPNPNPNPDPNPNLRAVEGERHVGHVREAALAQEAPVPVAVAPELGQHHDTAHRGGEPEQVAHLACSHIGLHPGAHGVAEEHIGLQPGARGVAAQSTWGCRGGEPEQVTHRLPLRCVHEHVPG